MLLFPTVLLTSLASAGGWKLTLEPPSVTFLEPPTGLAAPYALPVSAATFDAMFGGQSLARRKDFEPPPDEGPGSSLAQARGGFLHLELLAAHHFGAGPEVWWAMPDAPHEDLLRQRLVTPGIGVWYSALPRLFLGISANTWLSTLGETWFVNALSSEARVGFVL